MSSFSPSLAAKIPALDHLRALAITLVFLFHYRLFAHPDWVDTVGSFGWTGVDLFFVLSGYLIASQGLKALKQNRFSVRTFFIKRFFRILPAYWTVLIFYFALPAFREWEHLPPLWKFLTFTQNFGLDLRYQRTFSHAWSLCIEEQFYFIFPLAILVLSYFKMGKKGVVLIPLLAISGLLLRLFCWNKFIIPAIDTDLFGMTWYKWIYYPTYNRLDGILAGISIAVLSVYFPDQGIRMSKYSNIILLAGLLLAVGAWFLCQDPYSFSASIWGFPLVALAYGCMVWSGTHSNGLLNKFSSGISSALAGLSYSIYLTHKAAIHLAQMACEKLGMGVSGTGVFVFSVIMSLVFALAIRYCIEFPFLNIRKKLLVKGKLVQRK